MSITEVIIFVFALAAGCVGGYLYFKSSVGKKKEEETLSTEKLIEDAKKEVETKSKEMLLDAKEKAHKLLSETEKETRKKQSELDKLQTRLIRKEESIDKKAEILEKKESEIKEKEKSCDTKSETLDRFLEEEKLKLQQIAELTVEDARSYLLKMLERDLKKEYGVMIREYKEKAKSEAKKSAREIITLAIQRCAVDHVAESTVSIVSLANDEVKGRIIGREGRNIRAFENLTGVDLVVDDTPEAVVISSFDPIRREVARISLEKLLADGRIHPARIEELVEKTKVELEAKILEDGEKVSFDLKIHDLHPELIKLLGRLKYRTSYGQNVLNHSIEVCHLAEALAAELDVAVNLAKRAGLLHDIGKAIDFEVEGPHAILGADLAKRYRESKGVIHAIAAHHSDEEPQTIEAILINVADAISASRPGARREDLESYAKRLTKLEELATEFEGVEKAYAIQAGREVRIMVKPDVIDDDLASTLARDIAKKIENDLSYPGQIKVNVIRETRAISYAK